MMQTSERPPLTKLAAVMKKQGRSWKWLADGVGVSTSLLSLMVAGKRDYSTHLQKMADHLHLPPEVITPDREDAA